MSTATTWSVRMIVAARMLRSCRSVLVGIGEPVTAAMLAKRLHAPSIALCYESGVLDSDPTGLPLSIGDTQLVAGASAMTSMFDVFGSYLAAGRIEAGFVGCAQIDRHGNINSTVIGDYGAPKVRLPGSGGASDIVTAVRKRIVLTGHEKRRFPARVDFVTAPGPDSGAESEQVVVTDRAVLHFTDGELAVAALMPGVEPDDVRETTGWPIRFAPDVDRVDPPTATELNALTALRATKG